MASNFIKIFNDTVLKQTVLQGYELQRTNENLGQICMGELAFTRDTGRLFVGNFSTQDLELDTNHINGGILTGNKYIGIIDSRPLCHFNGNGSTGCYPLNYETDTTDRDENKVYPDEIGLFLSGSRYRPHEQNTTTFQYGGDGWNKKPEYIQKYGVYSGDYTFDIYNNALILFDSNIKLNSGETKLVSKTITDSETGETTTSEWKETDINGGKLIWNGTEESIKNNQETDITSSATLRSPICNIADPDKNISQYPIYGDNYVIMRILEPDGITIDYADRKFQDGEPVQSTEDTNTLSFPNWTHNILTVKYPLDKILENFDKNNFHKDSNAISLGSRDSNGDLTLTLPNSLSIEGTGWEGKNKIHFYPLKNYNNTSNEQDGNPFDDLKDDDPENNACFLTITKEGKIYYKSPLSITNWLSDTIEETIASQFPIHTINLGDGLQAIDSSNNKANKINLNGEDSVWTLELETGDFQEQNGYNPWDLTSGGTYNYAGTCGFCNGQLMTTDEYERQYRYEITYDSDGIEVKSKERTNFTNVVGLYESKKLVSVNYLKSPYTLHTGSGAGKAQFINLPYIASTSCENGEINVPELSKTTNTETEKIEDTKTVNGETTTIITTYETTYNYDIDENYNNDGLTENKSKKYYRIPKHANSVLLQIINEGDLSLYTNYEYNELTTSSKCIINVAAGTHIVEIPLYDGIVLYKSVLKEFKINNVLQTLPDDTTEEYTAKTFQYYVETSSNFTINLLGYRV